MAGEDFYVSFGSNAKSFSEQLRNDLRGARKEIEETARYLNSLAEGVGGFNAMRRLAQQGLNAQGGAAATGAGATGSNAQIDVGGATRTVAELMTDLQRFGGGMDDLINKMTSLVRTFGPVTDAIAKETAARNRAAGQVDSQANRANKMRDPATGHPVAAGTPGAVPFYNAPRPGISNAPRALVGEASLSRLVSAVERNVTATERVEAAINRLASNKSALSAVRPESGPAASADVRQARKAARDVRGQQVSTDSARVAKLERDAAEMREGIARYAAVIEASGDQIPKAAKSALTKLQTKLASAEQELARERSQAAQDETVVAPSVRERQAQAAARRQRKEENRQAAEDQRQLLLSQRGNPSLSQQQRVDRLADLNLPSSADVFRDMAMRRGDANNGLRMADLRRIASSFTEEGYPVQANAKSTKAQLTEGILTARKQYEEAGERTVHDLTTAGNTIATKVDAGLRRMLRRIIKAAEDSTQETQARDLISRDMRAGGGARFDINQRTQVPAPFQRGQYVPSGLGDTQKANEAFRTLAEKSGRVSETLAREAHRLSANPQFDPRAMRAQIQGRGPEAVQSRAALERLIRVTDSLDKMIAESRHAQATGRKEPFPGLDLLAEGRSEGQINRTRSRIEDQAARERASEQIRQEMTDRAAARQGALDALVRNRAVVGAAGSQFTQGSVTRALPGLRANRQGQFRFVDEGRDPAQLKDLQGAFESWVAAFRKLGQLREKGGAQQEIDGLEKRLQNKAQAFANQYEKLFPKQFAPALADQQGVQSDLNRRTQAKRDAEKAARAAELQDSRRSSGADVRAAIKGVKGQIGPAQEALEKANADLAAATRAEATARGLVTRSLTTEQKQQREVLQKQLADQERQLDLNAQRRATIPRRSFDPFATSALLDESGQPIRRTSQVPIAQTGISVPTPGVARTRELEAERSQLESAMRNTRSQLTDIGASQAEKTARVEAARIAVDTAKATQVTAQRVVDDLAKRVQALSAEMKSLRDATNGAKTAVGGKGSGSGGGTGGTTAAAAAGKGGNEGDVLQRILAKLGEIHATLRGTLKVAGTVEQKGAKTPKAEGAAKPAQAVARQPEHIVPTYSSAAGRRQFTQGLPQDLQQAIAGENKLAAATQLVQRGYMNQSQAISFFRAELGQTTKESQKFAQQLRSSVGDVDLQTAAQRGAKKDQALARAQAARDRIAAERERQQARTNAGAQATTSSLSTGAQAEITKLQALIRAGAENVKIVEQQVRAYRMLNEELGAKGFKAAQINQKFANISSAAGMPVRANEVKDIRRQAISTDAMGMPVEMATKAGRGFGTGMATSAQSAFESSFFGNHGFWSRVLGSTGTFIVRNFTAGFVFGMTNALQDIVAQGIETQSTWIRVSDALDATGRSAGNLRTQLQQTSTQYGTALRDVYNAAAGLTGVFDDVGDIAKATNVVSQLDLISNGALNATEAMGVLTSITSAYGDEAGGLDHVADVLTVIQNEMGINVEVASEGIARIAGQAKQMGIGFEDAATYVSAIAKQTNQTGAAAGEQFSRILAVMQSSRGQGVLQKELAGSGIELALSTRDYGEALKVLLREYPNLTKAQQDNIAVTLGGQRQAASFNALFAQGTKILNTAAKAHDANGQAAKRAAEIMKQLNSQAKLLHSNFVNFGAEIVDSGLLDFFGALLVALNKFLGGMNHLLSIMNKFADANGFTKFLSHTATGLAGLLVTLAILRRSLAGIRGAVAAQQMQQMVAMGASPQAIQAAVAGGGLGRIRDLSPRRQMQLVTPQQRMPWQPAPLSFRERYSPGQAAGRLADRLDSSAQRMRIRQLDILERNRAPRFQQMAISADVLGAPRSQVNSLRTQAVAANLAAQTQAKAAGAAAKAMSGTSRAFSALARSSMAAQVGTMALMLAVGLLIQAFAEKAATAKQQREDYEAKFGDDKNKTTAQKQEEFVGPSAEGIKATQEKANSRWGQVSSFFTDTKGSPLWNVTNSFGDLARRNVGDLPDEVWKQDSDLFRQATGSLKQAAQGPGDTSQAILEAQQEAHKKTAEMAKKIQEDESLSSAQKRQELANLELSDKLIDSQAKTLLLGAQGIAKSNRLTADNIQRITDFLSSSSSLSSSVLSSNASDVAALLDDIGLQQDSDVKEYLKQSVDPTRTSIERLQSKEEALKGEIVSARADFDTATGDDKDAKGKVLAGLLSDLSATRDAIVQGQVQGAQEMATMLRNQGDYEGATRAANAALTAIHSQMAVTPVDDPVWAQLSNQADQLLKQQTDDSIAKGQSQKNRKLARTRDSRKQAKIELDIAQEQYDAAVAEDSGYSKAEIDQLYIALQQKSQANLDAIRAQKRSRDQLRISATLNELERAKIANQIAQDDLDYARKQFGEGSSEANDAQAAANQTAQDLWQKGIDERNAATETDITRINPDDVQEIARRRVEQAEQAQRDAEAYGKSSTQYQTATQQLIEARRSKVEADQEALDADNELSIALAEAAGKTVDVANLTLKHSQDALAKALKKSRGQENPTTKRLRAQVVADTASRRDTLLQDQLDTIDFNRQMEYITAQQAADAIRQILKQKDLTEKQRRDLLLKIKGLEDEAGSEVGQFNLGDIKLPTVYEVRRLQGETAAVTNAPGIGQMIGFNDPRSAIARPLEQNFIQPLNVAMKQLQTQAAVNQLTALQDAINGVARTASFQPLANNGSATSVVINVNGGDQNQVMAYIRQYLGSTASTVRTSSPRKV